MKAISIKQPWASLVALGIKPIENRTWKLPEKHKGQRVLIHASAKSETDIRVRTKKGALIPIYGGVENYKTWFEINEMPLGAIIGSVKLVDCVINHPSIWAEKSHMLYDGISPDRYIAVYNWVLANPILFPEPIPAKGKLSFWDYPNIYSYEDDLTGEKVCLCRLDLSEEVDVMGYVDGELRCKYCGGLLHKPK